MEVGFFREGIKGIKFQLIHLWLVRPSFETQAGWLVSNSQDPFTRPREGIGKNIRVIRFSGKL